MNQYTNIIKKEPPADGQWPEPEPEPEPALPATTILPPPVDNHEFAKGHLAIGQHKLYPFSLHSKPLLDAYLRMIQIPLSDYTFANNSIWLSRKSGFFQIIEGCFCLFSLDGNALTMLLPPIGPATRQKSALQTCFLLMDSYNASPFLSKVEYVYRDFLQALAGDEPHPAQQDRPWLFEACLPDYIYRTESLIQLKGNTYKSKRNEINLFRRSYPDHRIELLRPRHWHGIRDLLDTWLVNRLKYLPRGQVAEFLSTAEQERQAIERAMECYDRLGLQGLALFIEDRLEGLTFGERITPHVASVLVEKTNFAISGAAQYLFWEFAKLFADCEYINVGDDLGMENLRRVKMSYRPALFGEKITLYRA